MSGEFITLDEDAAKRLRETYDKAVEYYQNEFVFDGHLLLTDYAKYILTYIEKGGKDG